MAARYPFLWHLPSVSPGQDRDRHGSVLDQMLAIIERGQESGDFDRALSPRWLLAAALALGRAAEDEVKAGRMTIDQATHAVHHSYLRLFGIQDPHLADPPTPFVPLTQESFDLVIPAAHAGSREVRGRLQHVQPGVVAERPTRAI